jgi:hypothetical protein
MTSNNAHETAKNIAVAKTRLEDDVLAVQMAPRSATPTGGRALTTTDQYAFAFDIDGVLVRGSEAIPEARMALKVLNGDNDHGVKV